MSQGEETVFDLEHMTLDELEKWAIEGAMRRNGGNATATTRDLKMGSTTLYRKLKRYGWKLPRSRWRPR